MDRSTEPLAPARRRLGFLGRDQAIVLACLAALTTLAFAYLLLYARGMGSMGPAGTAGDMAGMPGMAAEPPAPAYGLLAAMWAVMMAGMMLPSASPMILLYAQVQRRRVGGPLAATAVFVAGYLVVWTLFAVAAAALQQLLASHALMTAGMALASRRIAGAVLILAGLYELTPLKQACLRQCRGPVAFIAAHWRPGLAGGFRMGAEHGAYCLGCCWALMLLLFVGGVMSFAWILGLGALILAQKLVPGGRTAARVMGWLTGLAAIAAGALALGGLA